MSQDKFVRLSPWGVAPGYKLRRTLIAFVSVIAALAAIQTILSFIWILTGAGQY